MTKFRIAIAALIVGATAGAWLLGGPVAVASLLVGAVVSSWLTWRPLDNALIVAHSERRAAQYELADQIAGFDRYAAARDKQRDKDTAEFNDLWDHAEDLCRQIEEANEAAIAWEGRYRTATALAHDLANQLSAAKAHEAEIVEDPDPIDDTPMLRELEATMPVSPAPAYDFAAPTGSWAFVDIRPAIESGPSTDIDAAIDALVERVAA